MIVIDPGTLSSPSPTLDAGFIRTYWFELESISVPRIIAPAQTFPVTIRDAVFDRHESAKAQDDRQINVTTTIDLDHPSSIVWSSSDESVATVDQNGLVTHVDTNVSGTVTITRTTDLLTRSITLHLSRISSSFDTFADYEPGSLARHLCDSVDARIAGKNGATSRKIITHRDATSIVRNETDCWLAGVDLSGISPQQTVPPPHGTNQLVTGGHGVMISPRHMYGCFHAGIPYGSTVYFASRTNPTTIYTRTMVGRKSIDLHPQYGLADIQVYILDSDLPSDICFYKVMPSSAFQSGTMKLPSHTDVTTYAAYSRKVPVVLGDQYDAETIHALGKIQPYNGTIRSLSPGRESKGFLYYEPPMDPKQQEFWHAVIQGDSGSGGFLLINGELVLTVALWTVVYSAFITNYIDEINGLMSDLTAAYPPTSGTSADYQLTEIDLSGFNSY